MADRVSVEDAARALGVSARQVRSLIVDGRLPAERVGSMWLVDPAAVRARARHSPPAGRPLSPVVAWAVLRIAEALLEDPAGGAAARQLENLSDRQLRHRVRRLLAVARPANRWQQSLARRAEQRRYWVHPGLLAGLGSDSRLRAGGAAAVAQHGEGLSRATSHRYYVDEDVADELVRRYRMKADAAGPVELMVISREVPPELRPEPAKPVPLAVALADMLESDDARERQLADDKLAGLSLRG